MAATTTRISIANRALQLLGSQSISSINENSIGAKSILRAYDAVFLAELRKYTWNFSIKRASLAADPTAPIFGKHRYFRLPGDFLFLAPEETTFIEPRRRDFTIEGTSIVSDLDAPIAVRYVSSSIVEGDFDVLFAEALSAALAAACCEEITNSNTKVQTAMSQYELTIRQARKRNAIENAPVKSPVCSFIAVRN